MLARFAVVMPILLVPTTLMGTTLPLLTRHFVEQEQRSTAAASNVGTLYSINTFGAVLGIFLAGFVLLPNVGLALTNVTALSMNLCLGLAIFAFRGPLLAGVWTKGEPLEWLPLRGGPASKAADEKQAEDASTADEGATSEAKSPAKSPAKTKKKTPSPWSASPSRAGATWPPPLEARTSSRRAYSLAG
jgi:hypothetical protein